MVTYVLSTSGVTLLKCCLPCLPRSTSHSESHWHCPRCPLKCTSRGRLKYHLNCHDQGTTRSLRAEADPPHSDTGQSDQGWQDTGQSDQSWQDTGQSDQGWQDTGQSDQGWHSEDNDELTSDHYDEQPEEVEGGEDAEKGTPKEVCTV